MNCRQARNEIALWVGQDLLDRARRESLRRHLACCPDCRGHLRRLKSTLKVLEVSEQEQTYDAGDSMWPELAIRIRHLEASDAPSSRFNGWLPFVAVTAACALLLVVIDLRPAGSPATPEVSSVARDVWGGPVLLPSPPPPEHRNVFLQTGSGHYQQQPLETYESYYAIRPRESRRAERGADEGAAWSGERVGQ